MLAQVLDQCGYCLVVGFPQEEHSITQFYQLHLFYQGVQYLSAYRRFCLSALTVGLAMSLVTLNPDVLRGLGIATRRPGEDMKSMLRRADAALYQAKQEGRAHFHLVPRR